MLHTFPAAPAFTVATTAPAAMPSVLDSLDFLGRHCLAVALVASVAVLLMVVRGFAKDARQHRAIRGAYRQWSATGQPQPGWGPGWAWSGWTPGREDDDQAEDQADEVPPVAAEVEVCQSCHQQPASVTIAYAGGPTFAVCSGCSPVATVLGRAS